MRRGSYCVRNHNVVVHDVGGDTVVVVDVLLFPWCCGSLIVVDVFAGLRALWRAGWLAVHTRCLSAARRQCARKQCVGSVRCVCVCVCVHTRCVSGASGQCAHERCKRAMCTQNGRQIVHAVSVRAYNVGERRTEATCPTNTVCE